MQQSDYQRIENIRISLGMNTSAFAKAIGMSQPTYWRFIKNQGGGKIPASALMILMQTYKVNPEYLNHGTEPMFIDQDKKNDYEKLYEENISLKNSLLQLQEELIQYQRQEMSRLKNIEKPLQ